ncbi:hypothetical protein HDIA_2932 [Hartmannibacter diazotrophicus]|uniref:DUF1127 domain-containing protein n=1 Tax=Hartmannibacter diazotrophicus TaxID=1482074 RepID=A0A2C9D8A3_9HYPH|nr:hypothetical protein [Hartmannibacter diazotrophicus]SON56473.1 hypothetical protein HDIA_2932 [Hartmannibacter diazotrophicus]
MSAQIYQFTHHRPHVSAWKQFTDMLRQSRDRRVALARRRRVLQDLALRPTWQLEDMGLTREEIHSALSRDESILRLSDEQALRWFFR